jgi:hypothetical protein
MGRERERLGEKENVEQDGTAKSNHTNNYSHCILI